MKSHSLMLIWVCATFFQFLSQDTAAIFVGPEFNQPAKLQFQGILGEDSVTLFTVDAEFGLRKLKSIHLGSFDKHTLQKTGSFPIVLRDSDSLVFEPSEIFIHHGNLFMLGYYYRPNNEELIWKIFLLDKTGKPTKDQIVTSVKSSKSPPVSPKMHINEYEDCITVFYVHDFIQGAHQTWSIQQWTTELEPIREMKSSFPFRGRQIELTELKSSSQEYLVALGKEIQGGPLETDNQIKENNKFYLFFINLITHQTTEVDISLENHWIKNVKFLRVDDHWVVTGFYGENQLSEEMGVYFLKFNLSGELISAVLNALSESVIGNNPRNAPNQGNFNVIELLNRPDGKLIAVSEKQHKEVTPRYDARQDLTAYNDLFHFNEILVIEFNENGKVTQSLVIPKFQTSSTDQGSYASIFAVNSHDDVMILFNDHIGNKSRPITESTKFKRISSSRKSYLATWVVHPDFSTQHDAIFPNGFDYRMKPSSAYQSSVATLYFMAEKSNRYRLVRVEK